MNGGVTIDDQYATWVIFAEDRLQQGVVLETLDGRDRAGELRVAAEVLELGIAGSDVGADDVYEICSGDKLNVAHDDQVYYVIVKRPIGACLENVLTRLRPDEFSHALSASRPGQQVIHVAEAE